MSESFLKKVSLFYSGWPLNDSVVGDSFELFTIWLLSSRCWDCRWSSQHPGSVVLRALCMLGEHCTNWATSLDWQFFFYIIIKKLPSYLRIFFLFIYSFADGFCFIGLSRNQTLVLLFESNFFSLNFTCYFLLNLDLTLLIVWMNLVCYFLSKYLSLGLWYPLAICLLFPQGIIKTLSDIWYSVLVFPPGYSDWNTLTRLR